MNNEAQGVQAFHQSELDAGRFLVQRCGDCSRHLYYPRESCPHCGSVLLEVPDLNAWWAGVNLHESEGHPAYGAFIEWLRGRCYPNLKAANMAFNLGEAP